MTYILLRNRPRFKSKKNREARPKRERRKLIWRLVKLIGIRLLGVEMGDLVPADNATRVTTAERALRYSKMTNNAGRLASTKDQMNASKEKTEGDQTKGAGFRNHRGTVAL